MGRMKMTTNPVVSGLHIGRDFHFDLDALSAVDLLTQTQLGDLNTVERKSFRKIVFHLKFKGFAGHDLDARGRPVSFAVDGFDLENNIVRLSAKTSE